MTLPFIALSYQNYRNVDEQKEFLPGFSQAQRRKMMLSDQVTTARLFSNRVKQFWDWLTDSTDKPLGNVVDWFWRIEF